MGAEPCSLNTITIQASTMLLTQTTGSAVHLTQPAAGDDALPAIPPHWSPNSTRHDTTAVTVALAELREPRWASRTLCGIRWHHMAGSDPIGDRPVRDMAPTCRRCLAIVDRWFPDPATDDRVGLLAVMIGQAVHHHGTAEVVGVPGDQIAALRRAARHELKQRYGYTARTYVVDDLVVISSNDTPEALRHDTATQLLQAFGSVDGNLTPIDDSQWRFHWRTWSTA